MLGSRHGPEFHGDPERTPVKRGEGGGGGKRSMSEAESERVGLI